MWIENSFAVGLFLVFVGILMILFRSSVASSSIDIQNRFWGLSYGEKVKKRSEYLLLVFGSVLLLMGVLLCFQIVKLGHKIGQ